MISIVGLRRAAERLNWMVRVAIAATLVVVWIRAGAGHAWDVWAAGFVRFARPGAEAAPARNAGYITVTTLADAVKLACPGSSPILVISDDSFAWIRGNYILYPRWLDVVQPPDGFTAADLDNHLNSCLFTYGSERVRIEPFRSRLTPVECVGEDCAYRITGGSPR
ncbi:MAG: hypothetical protein EXR51_09050 [Dehalococcoidia bacterium]|nr:hypothetical protein [Dehalococcoidia bacterium]